MGIFKGQTIRLMRETWTDPQALAEEIFAILNSDEPIVIDSPVIIENEGDGTPLTINNHGNSDDDITINHYPDPPVEIPGFPPLDFPDGVGTVIIIHINQDGVSTEDAPADDPTDTTPRPDDTGGGGGFPGQVVSGGPGATYQVNVYESGLSSPPTERTVTQLGIDEDATIPADTWVTVGRIGSSYFMQVPVWL